MQSRVQRRQCFTSPSHSRGILLQVQPHHTCRHSHQHQDHNIVRIVSTYQPSSMALCSHCFPSTSTESFREGEQKRCRAPLKFEKRARDATPKAKVHDNVARTTPKVGGSVCNGAAVSFACSAISQACDCLVTRGGSKR